MIIYERNGLKYFASPSSMILSSTLHSIFSVDSSSEEGEDAREIQTWGCIRKNKSKEMLNFDSAVTCHLLVCCC